MQDGSAAPKNIEREAGILRGGDMETSLGYRLRLAQILAYRNFEEKITDQGVAPRYLGLLGIVSANPGQPQNKLAEAIGLQKSSLVTILDRLEKEGILERRAIPQDRRARGVWLTPRGEHVVAELASRAAEHEEKMAHGIPPEDRERLVEMLGRVIENLRS